MRRALLSVSDKTGIVEFAKLLVKYKYEIISTGGTRKLLEENDIPTTEISLVTGNPEAFGGRMKTISFQIESALLFDREKDAKEAEELGISPIDLVICNLYPFKKVKEQGADEEILIENIDIGGPTMIRAAAKNFKYVSVITNPKDYQTVMKEIEQNEGEITLQLRKKLMRKAFNHTADYDSLIAETMDELCGIHSKRFSFHDGYPLRYGENSHQKAFFYRNQNAKDSLHDLKQLHGKELSYNNIVDIFSALEAIMTLPLFACSVVKHNNPCGLAMGENSNQLLQIAWQGDPISAFGSIIAFNFEISLEDVTFLNLNNPNKMKRKFVEVIVAPAFTKDALEYLSFHKNLRVVVFPLDQLGNKFNVKIIGNSLLLQTKDDLLKNKIECVTEQNNVISDQLLNFGLHAVRQIKSNAIILVREQPSGAKQLLGLGAGQPNRLISTKLAIDKAKENLSNEYHGDDLNKYIKSELEKAVLISDAFFPFPDNVELAAEEGIRTIVQPGGSIRDKKIIQTCNKFNVTMFFTGLRHFKH